MWKLRQSTAVTLIHERSELANVEQVLQKELESEHTLQV